MTAEEAKAQFHVALRQFKDRQYEQSAVSFARVEAACPEELTDYFVMAKSRRAGALFAMKRWADALSILDELVADSDRLVRFPRERRPDELATIYWTRAVCLEQVGRLPAACDAVGSLIGEVGSGTTPTQRLYVAGAYLLQAKAAEARRRFDEALKAVDAAIAQCSRGDEAELKSELHRAEEMRDRLRARVRPAP
jgi:tetratricopeptide (TPR) repeat protein